MIATAGSGAHAAELPQVVNVDPSAPLTAARRIAQFSRAANPALVLLFASPSRTLGPLSAALRPMLPAGCRLVGCSTAGELDGMGYRDGGALAVVFPAEGFAAETVLLRDLRRMEVTCSMATIQAACARLNARAAGSTLGLVVADGLAHHADMLAATLDAALPGVLVTGGFGGNGLEFADVAVMSDGETMNNAAVLCLIATHLPVEKLVFAHFAPTNQRGVVTAADTETHAILELNAEPAAVEYARMADLDPERLTPHDFARHPLLLRVGRRHHVRAISGVRADGGLQMLAAIEMGAVLTLGRAENLVDGFAQALGRLPRKPALLLGFDCILRRLALEQAGLAGSMAQLHARYNICGFNTYGELHEGMHVNQTFVGIAFMPRD